MDPVTGLVSRGRMVEILDTMHLGGDQHAALVVLDLDHFKEVNDDYGHLAGDQALKDVATVLQSVTREDDVVSRWGGEEFLALLPRVPEHDIHAAADKLRAAVAGHTFRLEGAAARLTASVGATPVQAGASIRAMIAAGDDALYEAKRRGRNQTVVGRPRLDHVTVTGSHDLDKARRVVEHAATNAQLTPQQTLDAMIGVSEACIRLLPQAQGAAQLSVTVHDRPGTFTIIVEDRADRRAAPPEDELNAAVLRQVGDEVRIDDRDDLSDVRIVFAKPESTDVYRSRPDTRSPAAEALRLGRALRRARPSRAAWHRTVRSP